MLNYKFTFCFKITTRWNLTRLHATRLNQLNIIGNRLRNLRDTVKNTYKEKAGFPSVIRDTIRPVSVSLSDTTFCKNVYMKKPKTLTSH